MPKRIVRRVQFPALIPCAPEELKKVAAYVRVSTYSYEQENSLEAQRSYFEEYIKCHPKWVYVGIYADEGISGLRSENRDSFNRMIEDALNGKIDIIVTKSLSRFARNTVDTIQTLRLLKSSGIAVYFQKEDIDTSDAKGEFMLTLMSAFAQEESRSISENVTWGHRKRFADGRYNVPYSHFLGYQRGVDGTLEVDEKEAKVVKFIYWLFLQRQITGGEIVRILDSMNIPTPAGKRKWYESVVISILTNEKYVGDALLQKRFTVDFITKKCKKNEGELPQYYVRDGHRAVISRPAWDEAQRMIREMPRRNTSRRRYANFLECSQCGGVYGPKRWFTPGNPGYHRTVWECCNRYKIKHDPLPAHFYDEEIEPAISAAIQFLIQRDLNILLEYFDKHCAKRTLARVTEWFSRYTDSQYFSGDIPQETLIVIRKVIVTPNYTLLFKFIDGGQFKFSYQQENLCRQPNGKTTEKLCT